MLSTCKCAYIYTYQSVAILTSHALVACFALGRAPQLISHALVTSHEGEPPQLSQTFKELSDSALDSNAAFIAQNPHGQRRPLIITLHPQTLILSPSLSWDLF